MILQLTIQNFGLIDKVSLDFCDKLNILTGETGAGKSILIDALRYVLGSRMDSSSVRDPKQPCIVEAVFELSERIIRDHKELSEYIQERDRSFIINRSYYPDNRNKIKVNGFSITLAELKTIGDCLVDFHGPHDHQMLFSVESHLHILDRLCQMDGLAKEYAKNYSEYRELEKKIEEIQNSIQSRERDIDLLSHQIKELGCVPLEQSKYDELFERQKKINNSEKLYTSIEGLIKILEDEESGLSETVRKAFTPLKTLSAVDPKTEKFTEDLTAIQNMTDELLSELYSYRDSLSFEPDEAKDISARCDMYYEIIRKYGPTLEDAAKFYNDSKTRYDFLIDLEQSDSEAQKRVGVVRGALELTAQKMTKERKRVASILEKTIENELKELGIPHVRFECRIEKSDIGPTGQNKVTFFISPNAGEELKPLADIISSGEAARVMLALKKALTKVDPIPVLIFDEIDAQIGGRLGTITGKKLQELSRDRQVILITHLPQIACFADLHLKVSKKIDKNRTTTMVSTLTEDERVREMAKMMSGEKESDISITHAQDMLVKARTG